uniref:RNA helicase n=1 Tax=Amphimedon queenslandica TaxID=400682 RepID=A0A1X7UUE6_AMPQE
MADSCTFSSLGLSSWLVRQCEGLGFKEATPVQKNCIPPIMEGKDCIGSAKTGSGKTAAFALPILHSLSRDPYGIYALVLTPTRELAYQISDQFCVLGKHIGVKSEVIVGGV